jgi:2-deoxy-D-gluconate 3-dehydrogenase
LQFEAQNSSTNPFSLSGKVAIVTGGSRGIGLGMSVGLAEAGADVAVLGNSQSPDDACHAIAQLGRRPLGFQGDLTEGKFREEVVTKVLAEWGHIDILVNNAGITVRTPAVDFAEADWDKILGLNLTALFRMCQRVGREFINQKSGKIINVASIASFIGAIYVPAYTASKGGVAQVTKAMANEWARFNVNVNAIAPGYILTEMTRPIYDDPVRTKEILARVPAERWGNPQDLKGATVFLASSASDFIHGHTLVVDGGWMAR